MTRELTCIGCPMGCALTVEVENNEAVSVTGNTCKIGENYARTEISAPVRAVTTTALTAEGIPVPVKTVGSVPKDKIFEVVAHIKRTTVTLPVKVGDIILDNAADTGVAVAATASMDN
ncbi:MAG: DUF1667 domain-containing protein [Ruminococcus sp.]|nr:DUF1667 domain-containing protein [Ruminococcus sp.]